MPEKLKPCPFCGAKAIIHHDLCPKCEEKLNGWLNQKEATE